MSKRVKTWPASAGPGMGLEDPVFLNYKTKLLNEILSQENSLLVLKSLEKYFLLRLKDLANHLSLGCREVE